MKRKRWTLILLALTAILAGYTWGQEAEQITCTGKVIDKEGKPIAGVKVSFYDKKANQESSYVAELQEETRITSIGGDFVFKSQKPTTGNIYRMGIIVAEKEGLALGWANWNFREGDFSVDIKLTEPKILAGIVVDEEDKPVAGAEVRLGMLILPDKPQPRYLTGVGQLDFLVTQTDAEGRFAFTALPEGASADFVVKKAGRATVNTFNRQNFRGESLQFKAGQSDIKLVQPVEAKIEGTVVDKASGRGVGDVRLMLMSENRIPWLGTESVISKADGTFSFDSLSPGVYILKIVPSSPGGALEWVAQSLHLTVKTGETTSGVKIEVSKGGLLEVVVTEAAGDKPVEEARISIRDENNQWSSATSDKNGVASIRLAPGDYRLSGVYKEGYTSSHSEEEFTIEENETVRLEVQLSGMPKITGVVRDKAGKPLEGVKLKIMPVGNRDTLSDAQGRFEASWDPRGWGDENIVYYLIARYEEQNLAAAVMVEEDADRIDVKLADGIILTGEVVDPEGKAIADARILVMLRASSWGSSISRDIGSSDDKGRFEIRAIPDQQRYSVRASADGYGQQSVEFYTDDAVKGVVKVERLVLPIANLSITGMVVDADDKPVSGAEVYGYGDGQPDIHNIRTDEEGKFIIEKVCEGSIRINAHVRGEGNLYGDVETEGGATDVKIVMTERGSSASRYVPKTPPSLIGKPLPDMEVLALDLEPEQVEDKRLLVCFWDMEQRPSRYCIRELAKKTEELKEKDVTIVGVHASKVDGGKLSEWVKKYNITFPVGMVEGDEEETRFAWGVKSLPWLILTNDEHIVAAEGFSVSELDEKI
jgi:protocatechuate 3,4-dioxygenase beta subunit